MVETNYTVVSQSLSSPYYEGEPVIIRPTEQFLAVDGTQIEQEVDGYVGAGGSSAAVRFDIHDCGVVTVEAPETARYYCQHGLSGCG